MKKLNAAAAASLMIAFAATACFKQDVAKNVVVEGPETVEGDYSYSMSYYLLAGEPRTKEAIKRLEGGCAKKEEENRITYTCTSDVSWLESLD